ncbi:MAG: CpsD/CapB family tyrosine-protein kinase [Gammaproteobacteria bacterium]
MTGGDCAGAAAAPDFPASVLSGLAGVARAAGRPAAVAFAAAVDREGTSIAVAAFATFLARQQESRVLIVDANLRAPSQHAFAGVERAPGLVEVLQSGASRAATIHTAGDPRIQLLAAGSPAGNPERLLSPESIREAIDGLGGFADWIVFDCPPVNAYPDALSIAPACAATVLVVRSGRTRREIVSAARRRLTEAGANVAGVILNRRRYYIPESLYRWL